MLPGPELAVLLAGVDRSGLDADDLLRLAQARSRLVAHQEAQLLADLHAVARKVPDSGPLPGRRDPGKYPWAECEVAFALRWTHSRATGQLAFSDELIDRLPQVFAALSAGLLDVPKARLIADAVAGLADDRLAGAVVDKVLDLSPRLTTAQLRARLRRLVVAADPDAAAAQAVRDSADRRVQAFLNDNNLAAVAGYELAPHRVAAVMERLDAIAKAAKAGGDGRGMDQLRADALLDLLAGEGIATGGPITDGSVTVGDAIPPPAVDPMPAAALPGPRSGVVELQVPLATLVGLSRLPGELAGWGPVIADLAAQVTAQMHQAQWRFSVYNRLGELAHHGITHARPIAVAQPQQRRPSARVAAFVRARDRHCVAPGCRRAARSCDLDHTIDWVLGGQTESCNLGLLCRMHHLFKHAAGCQLLQLSPGVFTWSTPAGRQYVTTPDRPLIDDNTLTGLPVAADIRDPGG